MELSTEEIDINAFYIAKILVSQEINRLYIPRPNSEINTFYNCKSEINDIRALYRIFLKEVEAVNAEADKKRERLKALTYCKDWQTNELFKLIGLDQALETKIKETIKAYHRTPIDLIVQKIPYL